MLNNVIKFMMHSAVIMWISYTIYIIVPQLTGTDMTVGLGMILGLVGGSATWLEKLKLTEVQKQREHELQMTSLKVRGEK